VFPKGAQYVILQWLGEMRDDVAIARFHQGLDRQAGHQLHPAKACNLPPTRA
jgi:hypothetical protein